MSKNPNWQRDELILALDLYFKADPFKISASDPQITEISELLNSLPIYSKDQRQKTFRNNNSVHMKLRNFAYLDRQKGLYAGSERDKEVWDEFSQDRKRLSRIARLIKSSYKEVAKREEEEDEGSPEGKILSRLHRYRERDDSLGRKKKAQMLKKHGRLFCEVCSFVFEDKYGKRGNASAECHHLKPISEINEGEKTRLFDLIVICANCHRVIHNGKPYLQLNEIEELLR